MTKHDVEQEARGAYVVLSQLIPCPYKFKGVRVVKSLKCGGDLALSRLDVSYDADGGPSMEISFGMSKLDKKNWRGQVWGRMGHELGHAYTDKEKISALGGDDFDKGIDDLCEAYSQLLESLAMALFDKMKPPEAL